MVDVLIIGSGGAGLSAALAAKEAGAKEVVVATKAMPTVSQTVMAQGGINAALGNVEADSIEAHIEDTYSAARELANKDRIELLCSNAIETIAFLERIGVPFSRLAGASTPLKSIAQRKMGGASAPRACYAQDYTGLKIAHTLYDASLQAEIRFLPEHFLLEVDEAGALFLEVPTGAIKPIEAKATIIATGGYGAIYHGFCTNAYGATGDGIVKAYEAGAILSDLEFVQFHPTALKRSAILMSESARGIGGYLIDKEGNRFVDELKPRDEVARAIYAKIKEQGDVYLDLSHLDAQTVQSQLHQELSLAKLHEGVDGTKEPIPIKPVAHYTMGGIEVDEAMRIKGFESLFAVGECANAYVHGANRLGGNSLLEIVAFGRIAGKEAALQTPSASLDANKATKWQERIVALLQKSAPATHYEIRETLGKVLFEHAGIVRDEEGLLKAKAQIETFQAQLNESGIGDSANANNLALIEYLEVKSALTLAHLIVDAALKRKESRGAHFRSDYPQSDADFCKQIVWQGRKR